MSNIVINIETSSRYSFFHKKSEQFVNLQILYSHIYICIFFYVTLCLSKFSLILYFYVLVYLYSLFFFELCLNLICCSIVSLINKTKWQVTLRNFTLLFRYIQQSLIKVTRISTGKMLIHEKLLLKNTHLKLVVVSIRKK